MVTEASAQPAAGVSLASLLKSGFQIVSIVDLTSEEQKTLWPSDAPSPYIMLTLQKGSSVAACSISISAWIKQDPDVLTGNYCSQS